MPLAKETKFLSMRAPRTSPTRGKSHTVREFSFFFFSAAFWERGGRRRSKLLGASVGFRGSRFDLLLLLFRDREKWKERRRRTFVILLLLLLQFPIFIGRRRCTKMPPSASEGKEHIFLYGKLRVEGGGRGKLVSIPMARRIYR